MASLVRRKDGAWRVHLCVNLKRASKLLGNIPEQEAREIADRLESDLMQATAIEEWNKVSNTELNRVFYRCRDRARERGIDCQITRADVYKMMQRCGSACEVTGIPFNTKFDRGDWTSNPWSVSIDRIDSKGPYSAENCRLVCVAVNVALGQWGYDTLRKIAQAIYMRPNDSNRPARPALATYRHYIN